jgi:hypothetical protein
MRDEQNAAEATPLKSEKGNQLTLIAAFLVNKRPKVKVSIL